MFLKDCIGLQGSGIWGGDLKIEQCQCGEGWVGPVLGQNHE